MYDVEVAIGRAAFPLRVTGVEDDTRAFQIVKSALAAWGIPVPVDLRDAAEFSALLTEAGYYAGSISDAKVTVQRAEEPRRNRRSAAS